MEFVTIKTKDIAGWLWISKPYMYDLIKKRRPLHDKLKAKLDKFYDKKIEELKKHKKVLQLGK